MGRTKGGPAPSAAVAAALAGSVTDTDVAHAANGLDMILCPPAMQEYRVGAKKTDLPTPITGSESTAAMSLIFHMTTSILSSEASDVPVNLQLRALGHVLGQQTIIKTYVSAVLATLHKAIADPSCYTVKSYHSSTGVAIPATAYSSTSLLIVHPMGDPNAPMAGNTRRPADIAFVNVTVACNLLLGDLSNKGLPGVKKGASEPSGVHLKHAPAGAQYSAHVARERYESILA